MKIVQICFLCCALLSSLVHLYSDEYSWMITKLEPIFAGQIIRIFVDQNMSDGIFTMKEIGASSDPKINDIIRILIFDFGKSEKTKTELLLRILLESVYDKSNSEKEFNNRLKSNKTGIETLFKNIDLIESYLLKSKIISLLPYYRDPNYYPVIFNEGTRLTGLLKKETAINYELNEEIIQLIKAMDILDLKDGTVLCLEIMDNTRDKNIRNLAKTTLKKLLDK